MRLDTTKIKVLKISLRLVVISWTEPKYQKFLKVFGMSHQKQNSQLTTTSSKTKGPKVVEEEEEEASA
jgi:hypothetical protein